LSLAGNGAAVMITEKEFTSEKLKTEILDILDSSERTTEIKEKLTDAAGVIAETIIERYGN
ncbi:hypothetical protein ACFL6P_08780, partial [Candidatus Latescibacterota bacterium]